MGKGANAPRIVLEGASRARLLFTAPWEPVVVRRGDALGLRALTDVFAETVAPGLSNRVRDGRWVTILAWALARSHDVYHASAGRSVASRDAQRTRYAWLRPLELMWIARTISLAKEDWRDRTLPGRRSVQPWYERYRDENHATDRFGMTLDQFKAYRQTGVYGGYRVGFRKWPGMTAAGDGWTPSGGTNRLAQWLEARLGKAKPSWPLHAGHRDDGLSTRSAKLRRGEEGQWWIQHWRNFSEGGRSADDNTLPRRRDDFEVLPEAELLTSAIFGTDPGGERRRRVALEIEQAAAEDHFGICEHLGRIFREDRAIALLPAFSRLADSGMAAMDLVAGVLGTKSSISLDEAASRRNAQAICHELKAAADAWEREPDVQIRHIETAHRFAAAIPNSRPHECLSALLRYHEFHGGGVRWFVLRNGRVEPRMRVGSGVSRYGFRLYSLSRLATQCEVIATMPEALRDDDEAIEGED